MLFQTFTFLGNYLATVLTLITHSGLLPSTNALKGSHCIEKSANYDNCLIQYSSEKRMYQTRWRKRAGHFLRVSGALKTRVQCLLISERRYCTLPALIP